MNPNFLIRDQLFW